MPTWLIQSLHLAGDAVGLVADPKIGTAVFVVAVVIAVVRRGGLASGSITVPQGAFIALCAVGIISFGLNIARGFGLLGTAYMACNLEWGTTKEDRTVLHIVLDGSCYQIFAQDHYVMAVALHGHGLVDPMDERFELKSVPYDIATRPVDMRMKISGIFAQEMQNGDTGTSYVALFVPKSIRPEQFDTARQAAALGASWLPTMSGPP